MKQWLNFDFAADLGASESTALREIDLRRDVEEIAREGELRVRNLGFWEGIGDFNEVEDDR